MLYQNQQISYLTILEHIPNQGKGVWKCKCICGKIFKRKNIDISRLYNSCGCIKNSHLFKGKDNPLWQGFGEISKSHFLCILHSAKYRKIPFNITIEEISNLFEKQNHICSYTKIKLRFFGQKAAKYGLYTTASLDRINSSKGYELSNIEWVHKTVNRMKHTYSKEKFLNLCRQINKNINEPFTPLIEPPIIQIQEKPIILAPNEKICHITLIERIQVPNKNGKSHRNCWRYICDCGEVGIRREETIKSGHNLSCGCQSSYSQGQAEKNKKWKGYGEISALYYWDLKNKARKRKLEWSISIKDLWNLFLKQQKQCSYLKEKLIFSTNALKRKGIIQTASLDRIDSKKGYTLNNIEWVHKEVQMMKKDMNKQMFLNWIKLIIKYQGTSISTIPDIVPL